jgi:hypothetical protein
LFGAKIYIDELKNDETVAHDHENQYKHGTRMGYHALTDSVPWQHRVLVPARQTKRERNNEYSRWKATRRSAMLTAGKYIVELQQKKEKRMEASQAKGSGFGRGSPHNFDKLDETTRVVEQAPDLLFSFLDASIKPGTRVTRTFIFESTLHVKTITVLRSSNKAVIIVVVGTNSERKHYLCEIINHIWSLELDDVGAGFAHGNQWIAIKFRSVQAREIAYETLSETTFFYKDMPIANVSIRQFGERRNGDSDGETQRTTQVANTAIGKIPLLASSRSGNASEPVIKSGFNNSNEEKAPEKEISGTEAHKKTTGKTAREENGNSSQRSWLRKEAIENLVELIPERFFTKEKTTSTIELLFAASMHLDFLTNVKSGDDHRLPETHCRSACRTSLPDAPWRRSTCLID